MFYRPQNQSLATSPDSFWKQLPMVTLATAARVTCAASCAYYSNCFKGVRGGKSLCRTREKLDFSAVFTSRSTSPSKIVTWSQRGHSYTPKMETSTTGTKKKYARLNVKKRRTVPLPAYSDASGQPLHISVFLQEPEGMQCMLNTRALRKFETLEDGLFKCYLPSLEFLSFQVAPVIDLSVDATDESCQVDLISCKFEGSNLVRSQNERFSASLKNHLSWSSSDGQQQNLHVRLELNVILEVYTQPFKALPISAVETPGTLILQALLDRLIPLFLDQLLTDYRVWAESKALKQDIKKLQNPVKSH